MELKLSIFVRLIQRYQRMENFNFDKTEKWKLVLESLMYLWLIVEQINFSDFYFILISAKTVQKFMEISRWQDGKLHSKGDLNLVILIFT